MLFDWLTELYPVWATIDAGQVHAAATAGLAGPVRVHDQHGTREVRAARQRLVGPGLS